MGEEWKEAILRIWEMHQYVKPEFSCTLCRAKVNPPTCQGCPIYYHQPFSVIKWQTGEPNMEGEYLITRTAGDITCDVWVILEHYQYWGHHRHDGVVAWCKLRDIEPYKE